MSEGEAVRDNLDAPRSGNWHIDIHEQVELHAPNSRKRRKQKSAKERIGEYGNVVPCGRDDARNAARSAQLEWCLEVVPARAAQQRLQGRSPRKFLSL